MEYRKILVVFNFILIITFSVSEAFPEDVQQCKYEDEECIKKVIDYLFVNNRNGYPGLNLASLNPIEVKSMEIKRGEDSPVNIDLKFTNSKFSGIDTFKTYKVKGFGKNIEGPHAIYVKGKTYSIDGDYNIKGKVLILPISGSGKTNITMVNPDIKINFKGKPISKNGKIYLETHDFKLTYTITKMFMNFENLFNGDKALGDNMNKFLNENWEDIFHELKEPMFEAYRQVAKTIIDRVYLKTPYEELYLQV